jgi:hypothetical protein
MLPSRTVLTGLQEPAAMAIESWTWLFDFATRICILQNDTCISKESMYVLLYHFMRILF